MAKTCEAMRKQWLHAELEMKKYKELLVKSDVAKAALEVKLKHARNQLDVEMKKRYKVEGDYQYLVSPVRTSCSLLRGRNLLKICFLPLDLTGEKTSDGVLKSFVKNVHVYL